MEVIEDFGIQEHKEQRKIEISIFLRNIANKINKVFLVPGLALALSVQPAYSGKIDNLEGCVEFVDYDGLTSVVCDEDIITPKIFVFDFPEGKIPHNLKQDALEDWYNEYLVFLNDIDKIVAVVVESGKLPDDFFRNAQKIISDPNFDTLNFQLLGDIYRNAPLFTISTSEEQEAFFQVRTELEEYVGHLGIGLPYPELGKIPTPSLDI